MLFMGFVRRRAEALYNDNNVDTYVILLLINHRYD